MLKPDSVRGVKKSPIRILHVCESLPGGPASYLNEIIPYQSKIFGEDSVGVIIPRSQNEFIEAKFGVELFLYNRIGRSIRDLVSLFYAIRRAILTFKPDIIHLHGTFAGLVGRLSIIDFNLKLPIIYCAHGWAMDPNRSSGWRFVFGGMEYILSHLSTCTVNLSEHENDITHRWMIRKSSTVLIKSGISDFESDAPVGRVSNCTKDQSRNSINLLFIGRMDRQKGFDLLMDEVGRSTHLNFKLYVAGSNVVNQKKSWPQDPRVTFLGWVERSGISELLANCDAVIMPSRWEGLPLAAIEAMRSSKAVISSDRGPFPYMIQHGHNGIIMNIDRPGFLSRALQEADKASLRIMGANARETYEIFYRSERMNAELISLYEMLLGRVSQSA